MCAIQKVYHGEMEYGKFKNWLSEFYKNRSWIWTVIKVGNLMSKTPTKSFKKIEMKEWQRNQIGQTINRK